MHLGLARAQLLPRSDGYRRFTGSPIDALVYLVGLSCQIPIRLALRTIIHRRVAALPQRWPACRGDVRGADSTPMWFRMWRISALWVMKAMMRICPPHMGHSVSDQPCPLEGAG